MLNYTKLNYQELGKLIEEKDKGVFAFIYDKYSAAIYGLILQKVSLRKDADEILYQTFIALFNEPSTVYSAHKSMFGYLYNKAVCILKKELHYI